MFHTADQFFYGFNEPGLGTTEPIQEHSFLGELAETPNNGELLLQQPIDVTAGFGQVSTNTMPQVAQAVQSTSSDPAPTTQSASADPLPGDMDAVQDGNAGHHHGFVMYHNKIKYREEDYHPISPMQQLEDRFCGDHPDLPRHRVSLCSVPMAADSLRWVLRMAQEPFYLDAHPHRREAFMSSCNTLTRLAMARALEEVRLNAESDAESDADDTDMSETEKQGEDELE